MGATYGPDGPVSNAEVGYADCAELLVAQRLDGMDFVGAMSREVAGQQGDRRQHDGYGYI